MRGFIDLQSSFCEGIFIQKSLFEIGKSLFDYCITSLIRSDQEHMYTKTDIFAKDRMQPMNKSYEKSFQALINNTHRVTGSYMIV